MDTESAIMSDYESSCSPCAESDEFAINKEVTSPKPRYRKWALLDKSRRLKASARERKRRHVLNSALERLRKKVPCFDQNPQKLSKIEVLRQAIGYISDLSHCLENATNTSRLAMAALGSPVFLEPGVEFGNQNQTSFHSLGSVLYRKSMLLDCAQQDHPIAQNTNYDECFSPENPASQYACFDQSPSEEFEYGINNSELDIYLRGFSQ